MPAMMFANQVTDGSFESGALSPNWTIASGSNLSLLNSIAWTNTQLRSGNYGLRFDQGTSEMTQVVTGLLPGRRYKVYGGVQRIDALTTVKIGVRNYGHDALEQTADLINRTTPLAPGESLNSDAAWWTMYNQSFVTGASSTSAEIYVSVTIPFGSDSVFVDDIGLELVEEPDPQIIIPRYENIIFLNIFIFLN